MFIGRPNFLLRPSKVSPPILLAEYNVLSPGNYTLGTGTAIASLTDLTGNGRNAAQANASLQPNFSTAAINGLDAIAFTGTSNHTLSILNGTEIFANQGGMWWCGVLKLSTLPASQYLLLTTFSELTNGRFQVSILSTGKMRCSYRRNGADTNVTTDSAATLFAGVQSFVGVGLDTINGIVTFQIDDAVEVYTVTSTAFKRGRVVSTPSSSVPTFGRITTTVLDGLIGTYRVGGGIATPATFESYRDIDQPTWATPLQTLKITETPFLRRNRIYRNYNGWDIPFSGTVFKGSDSDIRVRFLDSRTRIPASEFSSPQPLTTSSGNNWSGTIKVPAGSWFLEVRKNGERDADAVVDTTNIIGVGSITFFDGQSLIRNLTTEAGSPYPMSVFPATGDDLKDRRWSWNGYGYYYLNQTPTSSQNVPVGTGEPMTLHLSASNGLPGNGNGQKQFGTLMRALENGTPALVIPMAIGGTLLSEHLGTGFCWANTQQQLSAVEGPGYNWDRAVLGIGQSDMLAGTSYSDYYDQQVQYFNQIRSVSVDGNLLICYVNPASWLTLGNPTASNAQAVTKATWDLLDGYDNNNTNGTGRIYLGWTDHDLPRMDGAHISPRNSQHSMHRFVQNIAYREKGAANGARGPKLTSISGSNGGTTVVGSFVLDGGTTLQGKIYNPADPNSLTPTYQTTGLTGTVVRVNGVEVTPSSVEITSSTQVTWSLSSPLTTGDIVDIGLYIKPDFSQAVMIMDDSNPRGDTIGVPAQPTRLWISTTI